MIEYIDCEWKSLNSAIGSKKGSDGHSEEVTPDPIPNSEVKLFSDLLSTAS